MVGPCGEEILSAAACALQPQDTVALHYRHLGISMARSLLHTVPGSISFSSSSLLEQIILDRARAYVVSKHDPVTGGVHCALGSTLKKNDFVVTSTLASQCPPAVGRANKLLKEKDDKGSKRPISFVSIGDGYVLWMDVQISDDI
jgi:TPP-dependent pyruvate/acetoin dehydrogenase alpha subunit